MIGSIFKFTFSLLLMLVVLLPLNYYILEAILDGEFGRIHYLVFTYFTVLVFSIQWYMLKLLKQRPQKFVIGFMASMGIKIFLSLIILAVIIYFGGAEKKTLGLNFAVLYLLFTSFSVSHILRAQKASLEQNK